MYELLINQTLCFYLLLRSQGERMFFNDDDWAKPETITTHGTTDHRNVLLFR